MSISINPLLLALAKANSGLDKQAFIPAGPTGGDPASGGDPAQAGAAPPPGGDPAQAGAPPGMPSGDPSQAGAAPPPGGDPAAGGGAPPPDMMNMIMTTVTQAVQQAMQMQGGQPGAAGAGGPKKSKGGDEVAMQLYKTNVFLMAIITGLNKSGVQIEIPPEAMLGPPPGMDPAMAGQAGAAVPPGQPGAAAPGADPNAAGGAPPQDPNAAAQPPQMQFAPAIAPKTAASNEQDFSTEDAALAMGIPFPKTAGEAPIPGAMTELFGVPGKQAQATPALGIQDRASAVSYMIAAARQNRKAIVQ